MAFSMLWWMPSFSQSPKLTRKYHKDRCVGILLFNNAFFYAFIFNRLFFNLSKNIYLTNT